MEVVELAPKGVLLSYTVSHFPPTGFEFPVTLGLVELEGDAIVLALGTITAGDHLEIGMQVEIAHDDMGRLTFSV